MPSRFELFADDTAAIDAAAHHPIDAAVAAIGAAVVVLREAAAKLGDQDHDPISLSCKTDLFGKTRQRVAGFAELVGEITRRSRCSGTNFIQEAYPLMTDPFEQILAPAVVERAMSIYESFGDRQHADIVQARKALTRHVFGLICGGETSPERLTVSGLAYLKQLERERQAG